MKALTVVLTLMNAKIKVSDGAGSERMVGTFSLERSKEVVLHSIILPRIGVAHTERDAISIDSF
jgi:hypothetical protein